MSKQDWLDYFEAVNGRSASAEEIASVSTWEDVPGTTIESCGNYKDHSLFSAKEWCRLILDQGISDNPFERHIV